MSALPRESVEQRPGGGEAGAAAVLDAPQQELVSQATELLDVVAGLGERQRGPRPVRQQRHCGTVRSQVTQDFD